MTAPWCKNVVYEMGGKVLIFLRFKRISPSLSAPFFSELRRHGEVIIVYNMNMMMMNYNMMMMNYDMMMMMNYNMMYNRMNMYDMNMMNNMYNNDCPRLFGCNCNIGPGPVICRRGCRYCSTNCVPNQFRGTCSVTG